MDLTAKKKFKKLALIMFFPWTFNLYCVKLKWKNRSQNYEFIWHLKSNYIDDAMCIRQLLLISLYITNSHYYETGTSFVTLYFPS